MILSHLMDVYWFLIIILPYIFLVTNYTDYLLMGLFAIYVFLVEISFHIFFFFFFFEWGCVCCCYWVVSYSHILVKSSLPDICFTNIFFCTTWLFTFLTMSFEEQMFSFYEIQYINSFLWCMLFQFFVRIFFPNSWLQRFFS